MGAPEFKWKGFFKQHGVQVFSSNYALYGYMSAREMNVLESFEADIEVYSIDEAFMHISQVPADRLRAHALQIKRTTQQWTGIPISIGLAPTRTLAKLTGKAGKKQTDLAGVLVLNSLSINLNQYTADTTTLIRAGSWGLKRLYQPGYTYYKAGLMLNDLIPEANQQYSMFAPAVYDEAARQLMQLWIPSTSVSSLRHYVAPEKPKDASKCIKSIFRPRIRRAGTSYLG